jgi:hypothetical protein
MAVVNNVSIAGGQTSSPHVYMAKKCERSVTSKDVNKVVVKVIFKVVQFPPKPLSLRQNIEIIKQNVSHSRRTY